MLSILSLSTGLARWAHKAPLTNELIRADLTGRRWQISPLITSILQCKNLLFPNNASLPPLCPFSLFSSVVICDYTHRKYNNFCSGCCRFFLCYMINGWLGWWRKLGWKQNVPNRKSTSTVHRYGVQLLLIHVPFILLTGDIFCSSLVVKYFPEIWTLSSASRQRWKIAQDFFQNIEKNWGGIYCRAWTGLLFEVSIWRENNRSTHEFNGNTNICQE